jgi:hypothetical protein
MATNYKRGPLHLDAKAEILFRGDSPVVLGQRAAALLRALVERAGVPVSKDTLIEAAWPDLRSRKAICAYRSRRCSASLGKKPVASTGSRHCHAVATAMLVLRPRKGSLHLRSASKRHPPSRFPIGPPSPCYLFGT